MTTQRTDGGLKNAVAVVTGASRGVGRGIALGLGERGATVYITGRTVEEGTGVDGLPGTIHGTAEEVRGLGGRAVPVRCDHRNDVEVNALFDRVREEYERLDVLVNNVWGGYEQLMLRGRYIDSYPFWEQPIERLDSMFAAGVRAHYVSSVYAAQMMTRQRSGLIVTISFWAAQKFVGSPAYGAAKAADDKLARDMAHQLRPHNVASVGLYPGLVRTENVLRYAEHLDLSSSESPLFVGRAVAALAADPNIMAKTGEILVAAELAREYGFIDADGRTPRPLTLDAI
jgi:NAD(P)-dependent dehydrogenase (short-subunit alcohol dehydrogenase family)